MGHQTHLHGVYSVRAREKSFLGLSANTPGGSKVDAMANSIYMMEKGLFTDVERFEGALKSFNGDSGMQAIIIEKANKNIIGDEGKYNNIRNSLTRDEHGKIDENLLKGLDKKLVEEGNAHVLIKHDIKSMPAQNAYAGRLGKLSPQDFAKQKELNPATSAAYKTYLNSVDDGARQSIARYLSPDNRKVWKAEGLL